MKEYVLELNNGKKLKAIITNEELIYGVTAVAVGTKNEYLNLGNEETKLNAIYAYHPVTHERIDIVVLDNKMLSMTAMLLVPAHIKEHFDIAEQFNLNFKQVVAPYFKGVDEEALNPNAETQFRRSVIVVVKDPKTDKYLCVNAVKRVCKSFVMGGIEGNETIEEAALRETAEETGYTDVKITRVSMFELHNHFYAAYKGVNRYAHLYVAFGELNSDAHDTPTEEELAKQTTLWLNKEELKDFLSVNNNIFVYNYILEKDYAYEADGMMINSNELNGKLRSEVAK